MLPFLFYLALGFLLCFSLSFFFSLFFIFWVRYLPFLGASQLGGLKIHAALAKLCIRPLAPCPSNVRPAFAVSVSVSVSVLVVVRLKVFRGRARGANFHANGSSAAGQQQSKQQSGPRTAPITRFERVAGRVPRTRQKPRTDTWDMKHFFGC